MAWRGPVKKVTNPAPNPVQSGNEMSGENKTIPNSGYPFKENRAFQVRRDKDKEKNFGVNLLDIDTTILSYLDTVISPTIIDAGRQIKVPINYASPERWKAIRKDGALRDKHGKFQTPAIAFRRSTMQRNDGLITFNRYLQYPVVKKFSEKNKYDRFSVMNGFSPLKEVYSVAMPDHVIVNYDFIIWTELVEQANKIVEDINFSTEDYWGDKERYKFRTTISDYNFETTVDAGNDRVVRTTFSMMVYAYLLPDKYENYKSVVEKAFTTRKVIVNFDAVLSGDFNSIPATRSLELYSLPNNEQVPVRTTGLSGLPTWPAIMQTADYAFTADFAQLAATASYLYSQVTATMGGLNILGAGHTGSFFVGGENGISGSDYIDTVSYTSGNAAKWLISVDNGSGSFKASEVLAAWDSGSVSFNVVEVNEVGSVPVTYSVNNSGGTINLQFTPLSGAWDVKYIRMSV